MNNQPLENDGMPVEIDFTNAVRGTHHVPSGAKVFLPASAEKISKSTKR